MEKRFMRGIVWGLALCALCVGHGAWAASGPAELRVDDLKTPLGIDDAAPRFSWQLVDEARGARQTAYEVQVATQAALLDAGKADVWDSGRVESDHSLNVGYAGPGLQASTRYFWRVMVWDAAGKPYVPSATSWWETGLLKQDNWRAQWIGYETAEEAAVRAAKAAWITVPDVAALGVETAEEHVAYRTTIKVDKPVKRAVLYATGQDTVSAWVDGRQLLKADPLPAWKQMPWKKFVRAEVTGGLPSGASTIAIEAVHYVVNPNGKPVVDATPMIATLFVEYADGSTATFGSGAGWKVAVHAAAGWEQKV